MSLTHAEVFECPYCMTPNDIEIDEQYDIGQQQIVDCQICCSPIEVFVRQDEFGLSIEAKTDSQ